DLLSGTAFVEQTAAFLAELVGEGRRCDADLVAGSGLEQDGVRAFDRLGLKGGNDGAAGHRFAREEVGRTDEDADPRAALGQRTRQRGHGSGRTRVVNAAGEEHMNVSRIDGRPELLKQGIDRLLPEDEARPWSDMSAALPPLEHEPPRSV